MKCNQRLYEKAFNKWLLAKIPKGSYSKAAKQIFSNGHDDPSKAFRRRRNEGTSWKVSELCVLAEYLEIDVPAMFNQIEGIYELLLAEKTK